MKKEFELYKDPLSSDVFVVGCWGIQEHIYVKVSSLGDLVNYVVMKSYKEIERGI